MTTSSKYRFMIDENGDKAAVLIEIDEYEHLLEEVEELESLRQYGAAKASHDDVIPFDEAIVEIEKPEV